MRVRPKKTIIKRVFDAREQMLVRLSRCWVLAIVVKTATLLAALVLIVPGVTNAAPETWFNPTYSFTGNAASGFGSAVSCSGEILGLGHSYFAIGAPLENSGDGRVYIYGPSGLVATLSPPVNGQGRNFGRFVTFVTDIDNDTNDELIVAEPGGGSANGRFYVYLSGMGYSISGNKTGLPSYGSFILPTSNSVSGGVQLVISTPQSADIETVNVTYSLGTCTLTPVIDFNSSGPGGASSRYGQSMAEINSSGLRLLVGAPMDGTNEGALYSKAVSAAVQSRYQGSTAEILGAAVAARVGSFFFGFSAPFALSTSLYIKQHDGTNSFTDRCNLSIPMQDLSASAAKSVAHLGAVFAEFLQVPFVLERAVFGAYHGEASTGGSVALVGVSGAACGTPRLVNNCIADANQRQGEVLDGGVDCIGTFGRKLLLVGAPGYSSNAGRVDIYAEGTQLGAAAPCGAPTNTPTATPTFTPTPTATATATPVVAMTAEPTITATPGFQGTPIPVDQSTQGLPAPQVQVNGKEVSVLAPALVSKSPMDKLTGYLFDLAATSKTAALSALTVEALGKAFKKRQIFSKRNRISLRGLKPGTYVVSYRPVFSTAKKKRVLGKLSRPTTFTVRRGPIS